MNVLVVEPSEERRDALVDALCELRDVEVRGAAGSALESRDALTSERIDVVVMGAVLSHERAYIMSMAGSWCRFVEAADITEVKVRVAELALTRDLIADSFSSLAARAKIIAFERDTAEAGPNALAHHLRVAHRATHRRVLRGTQSIQLQEWLPAMIGRIRSVVPDHIELVPIIAEGTPSVRCVPAVLEHVMLEIVLKAAAKLPWGGTIWLTADRCGTDEVLVDVLENGNGTGHDLTLRATASAAAS
jgi:DNA-binding NarL/FixJ family response regulator